MAGRCGNEPRIQHCLMTYADGQAEAAVPEDWEWQRRGRREGFKMLVIVTEMEKKNMKKRGEGIRSKLNICRRHRGEEGESGKKKEEF